MQLEINEYNPMGGGSWIESPQWAKRKDITNVKKPGLLVQADQALEGELLFNRLEEYNIDHQEY